MRRLFFTVFATLVSSLLASPLHGGDDGHDPVLSALVAELDRSMTGLSLPDVERPSFVSYTVDDTEQSRVEATFGALTRSTRDRSRLLRTEVRVGSHDVDSSEFTAGRSPFDPSSFPRTLVRGDDEAAIRHDVWLATDDAYKAAAERLAQKKAVLAGRVDKDPIPDFTPEKPLVRIAAWRPAADLLDWPDRVRRLSALFRAFPGIQESSVVLTVATTNRTLVNSEGTRVRQPFTRATLEVQASTQAEDGAPLRHALSFFEPDLARLPSDEVLSAAVRRMAGELVALRTAPVLDGYTGPVLFTGEAAPALFADLLAPQLSGRRPPLTAQGGAGVSQGSELAGRIGRPVLPAFLDVVDDPTASRDGDRSLAGTYEADDEGVPARPVTLVEKGVLKTLLMGRRPRKEVRASNGHARGTAFQSPQPQIANLFVRTRSGHGEEELKRELIQQAAAQGLAFGLVVRNTEAPPARPPDPFGLMSSSRPRSPLGAPVLVYEVLPDGREELVRGLAFGETPLRDLRDISAAGDVPWVLSRAGGSAPAPASVVAPAVLFPEMELRRDTTATLKPALLSNPFFDRPAGGKPGKR